MARVLKNSRQLHNHPLQIYRSVSELQTDVVSKRCEHTIDNIAIKSKAPELQTI